MNQEGPITLLVPAEFGLEIAMEFKRADLSFTQGSCEEDGESLSYFELPGIPDRSNPKDMFVSKGIAYEWRRGTLGEATCERRTTRFTADGQVRENYIKPGGYNPDLHQLLHIMNTSPKASIRLAKLENYIREHRDKVNPLPWKYQVQYGKVYRAGELLKPEKTNG